ncbi:MAG TPA: hypothetical protein VHS31_02480, partial [Tepidisphaeraceae bacterium]|nr:hypothetical protein [Tepidisphaeraceae bacterium]
MRDAMKISDEADSAPTQAAVMFILAAFSLGQAININNGTWNPIAMAWLSITILTAIFGLRSIASRRSVSFLKISPARLIRLFLIVQWGQLLLWGIGVRRSYSEPIWIFIIAMLIAGSGAILLLRDRQKLGISFVIAGHLLAGAYVIRGMNPPHIDVWDFQQDSTAALMHGQNPYTVRYRNIYEPANDYGPGTSVNGWMTFSFPYPPLTLLFDLPGRLLGDIRWSHLFALEIAAILIAITWYDRAGPLAAAMLLLSPSSLFVIYSAWTEPMVILSFAAMLYCARHRPNLIWLPLGFFIAGKQYAIFV